MKNRCKRMALLSAVAIAGALCLQLAGHDPVAARLAMVPMAEAVVGRPMTPVSVAGVARRCAVGVTRC